MVFIQGSADEDEDGMTGEGQMAGIPLQSPGAQASLLVLSGRRVTEL